MTPRDRVIRALTFGNPGRAPRDLWSLPGVAASRPVGLARMWGLFPLPVP